MVASFGDTQQANIVLKKVTFIVSEFVLFAPKAAKVTLLDCFYYEVYPKTAFYEMRYLSMNISLLL